MAVGHSVVCSFCHTFSQVGRQQLDAGWSRTVTSFGIKKCKLCVLLRSKGNHKKLNTDLVLQKLLCRQKVIKKGVD
jgi:hypothetical protein